MTCAKAVAIRLMCAIAATLLGSCSGMLQLPAKGASEQRAPSENTISTDRPLVRIVRVDSPLSVSGLTPLLAQSLWAASPLAPLSVQAPPALVDESAAPLPSAPTPLMSTSAVDAAPTLHNATEDFTAKISVTATFPDSVKSENRNCEVLAPFASVTCALSGFDFVSSLMTGGLLKIKAISRAGALSDALESNGLTVKKYILKQITALSTLDDVPDIGNGVLFNDRLYFSARNSAGKTKLYSTNGTDLRQQTDLVPGGSDGPQQLTLFNGRLYFVGNINGAGHTKMLSTDGSDLKQHTDLRPGSSDGPYWLRVLNDRLYFTATDAGGHSKLYSTDGSEIRQITDIQAGGNDVVYSPVIVGDWLVFSAQITVGTQKLFATDGATLNRLSDISPGFGDQPYHYFDNAIMNGRLYFRMADMSGHVKLYSTNGTDLKQHTNLTPAGSDGVSQLKIFKGRLYFAATSGSGYKLYSTDGASDLKLHTDIVPGGNDFPYSLTIFNDRLYFSAKSNAPGDVKLYSTDGSDLKQVSNINPGGSDGGVTPLTIANDRLFFVAGQGTVEESLGQTNKLYATDGEAIQQVTNLNPGNGDGPQGFAVWDGRVFFAAHSATSVPSARIYSSEGSDLVQISDGSSSDLRNDGSSDPGQYYFTTKAMGSKLYLEMADPGGILRLYSLCSSESADCSE